ncbi:MAG: hypothetical protein CMJ64_22570 [Planctomycetaceae bacterium]|nr:hypothetical protein [Planctomycetaceae bacterium]
MKLQVSLIAAILVFASASSAQAQTNVFNAIGRYLGWGISDGYHANRSCGACSTCATCEAQAYPVQAQPPLAAPMQHTHRSAGAGDANVACGTLRSTTVHFRGRFSADEHAPQSFRPTQNIAPYAVNPRVFAQPQEMQMYQPARPAYTPVSIW